MCLQRKQLGVSMMGLNFLGGMSLQQKHGGGEGGGGKKKSPDVADKVVVVVAVKASKEIPRRALVWALTHVVQPGDHIMLLVVIPPHSHGSIILSSLISPFVYLINFGLHDVEVPFQV